MSLRRRIPHAWTSINSNFDFHFDSILNIDRNMSGKGTWHLAVCILTSLYPHFFCLCLCSEVFVSSRFMSGVTKKPTGVVNASIGSARPVSARQSVGGSQRASAVEKWSDASQSIDDDAASFQNLLGPSFGRPSSAASTPQRMSLPSALPSQSPARTPVRSRISDVSSRSTVTPSRSDPLLPCALNPSQLRLLPLPLPPPKWLLLDPRRSVPQPFNQLRDLQWLLDIVYLMLV
jgi:hypothetical protein